MIDYLQLMTAQTSAKVVTASRKYRPWRNLKALAKRLNVPVIALSQLSRAVGDPMEVTATVVSDLRWIWSYWADADIVSFMYRPDIMV
jgi:replicative DNA helicase